VLPRARRLAPCLLAAVLAAAAAGCTGGAQPGVARGGTFLTGYPGTAVVSADGRTVTVGPYPPDICPAAITAVARESKTRVALYLEQVTPPDPPSCGLVQGAEGAPVWAYNLRLSEPLGNRKLVNGATGRAVAWISSRLVLRPAALRAGYHQGVFEPTGDTPGTYVTYGGAAGAIQYFNETGGPNDLVIVQSAGKVDLPNQGPEPPPGPWVPVVVRGQAGRGNHNMITWRENGLTDYIVNLPNTDPSSPRVLTMRQLIAVADSAPAFSSAPVPP